VTFKFVLFINILALFSLDLLWRQLVGCIVSTAGVGRLLGITCDAVVMAISRPSLGLLAMVLFCCRGSSVNMWGWWDWTNTRDRAPPARGATDCHIEIIIAFYLGDICNWGFTTECLQLNGY